MENCRSSFLGEDFSQKIYILNNNNKTISNNGELAEIFENFLKTSITLEFSYYSLIWMFNSRNLNNRINRILERALRLFYWNNLSFSELLELDTSVAVRQKNLQVLVTEIYKVKSGMAPEIMKDSFKLQNPSYNLRSSCIHFRR